MKKDLQARVPIRTIVALLIAGCGGASSQAGAPQAQGAAGSPPVLAGAPATADAGVAPLATDPIAGTGLATAYALEDYGPPPETGAPPGAPLPTSLVEAMAVPHHLYVATHGNDSDPGSVSRPFRSIARAARASIPGTTVHVAPGRYEGGFRTSVSGLAGARIYFVSTAKWGAKIVPPAHSTANTAWDNRGSFVDIVGFEIDGSEHRAGTPWTHGLYSGGSNDVIRNNRVHHIANAAACSRAGGAGINVDGYYRGVASDVISNLVHDIGPRGCRFVQGIYFSTTGSIKNNVVYRVAEAGIHLWHDAHEVVITNNTVTNSNTGIIVGGGDYYHTSGPNDHTAVYSNIVVDNQIGISEQGRTGTHNSYRNNLVYQNGRINWSLKNGLQHSGTVSAAPLFATVEVAGMPGVRPSVSSPAVGRATPAQAESTDFEGRPRNDGAGYDIGALQH